MWQIFINDNGVTNCCYNSKLTFVIYKTYKKIIHPVLEPVTKRLKSSTDLNSTPDSKWTKLYGSELIVYDKHNRCLLTNGEYDLVLHDATPGGRSATIARSPHKALMAQWETIPSVS